MKKNFLALLACISSLLPGVAQTVKTPQASLPQTIRQDFGLSDIEISYSRPGIKGRTIFGDLVPYRKVWRTGANGATIISFGDEVTIGGTKIPAGKYGLLSIPGADDWTIIISKQLDVTSPAAYHQDQDILRVQAKPIVLPYPMENFTILFNNMTGNSCELTLVWDRTMVSVPIQTDIDGKIMKQIDDAMNKDNKPYFNSALYYMENGKDLNQALVWFDKAAELNPTAFFIFYQKARCQVKLGKKQEAIATARKSIELAKIARNDDYVTLNEKLIAGLR